MTDISTIDLSSFEFTAEFSDYYPLEALTTQRHCVLVQSSCKNTKFEGSRRIFKTCPANENDNRSFLEKEFDMFKASSEFHLPAAEYSILGEIAVLEFKKTECINFSHIIRHLSGKRLQLPINSVISIFTQLLDAAIDLDTRAQNKGVLALSFANTGLSNVFLTPQGDIRIAGLSDIFQNGEDCLARTWTQFTPPELSWRGCPVSHSSDIYAAGVCLFQLATARSLFNEGAIHSMSDDQLTPIIYRMFRNVHPAPSDVNPSLQIFDTMVAKCLQWLPANRYKTLFGLQKATSDLGISVDETKHKEIMQSLYQQYVQENNSQDLHVASAKLSTLQAVESI